MAGAAGAKGEVQREEKEIESKLTDSGGEEGKEMTWEEKKKVLTQRKTRSVDKRERGREVRYMDKSMWTPELYTHT